MKRKSTKMIEKIGKNTKKGIKYALTATVFTQVFMTCRLQNSLREGIQPEEISWLKIKFLEKLKAQAYVIFSCNLFKPVRNQAVPINNKLVQVVERLFSFELTEPLYSRPSLPRRILFVKSFKIKLVFFAIIH